MNFRLANTIFTVPILALTAMGSAFAQGSDTSPAGGPRVTRQFDFSAPALNFESTVPRDANVQTAPMEPNPPDTIGNLKVIGKITSDRNNPEIETSILGYNLPAPATAWRLCTFEVEALGYVPRISKSSDDLTEVGLLAQKADNGKPKSAAISYCFVRDKQAVGVFFIVDVSHAASMDAANNLVHKADRYATALIDSLSWADGKQSSFGREMQEIPLRIGVKEHRIRIPKGWDVPINDFHGPLPAELHMVRRKNGKDVGLVWLFVQNMKEKPDLETAGAALVKDYFVKQTSDARSPVRCRAKRTVRWRTRGLPRAPSGFPSKTRRAATRATSRRSSHGSMASFTC